MTSRIVIRRAKSEDVPELVRVYSVIHQGYESTDVPFDEASTAAFVETHIALATSEIVVIVNGETIVGVCTFFIFSPFFNNRVNHATILTLWVSPDLRGKGFGDKLLSVSTRVAKNHKCTKIIVGVPYGHTKTSDFMRSAGFKLMDSIHIKEVM